jgi:hypothetical protein
MQPPYYSGALLTDVHLFFFWSEAAPSLVRLLLADTAALLS